MSSDWFALGCTVASILAGVSYWGGRLARALEGIEATMQQMARRQDETEKHVGTHDARLARLEAFQEIQS